MNRSSPLPRCLILLSLGLLATGCESRPDADEPDATTRAAIDSVIAGLRPAVEIEGASSHGWSLTSQMQVYDVPAVSTALVRENRIAWTHAVGTTAAGTGDSISSSTFFMAKSIAKPVTAFAVLRLVDRGVLELDAPLDRYLERWSIPDNEFTRTAQPTLRQLLAHRAGFTVWGVPSYGAGEPLPTLLEAIEGRLPAEDRPVEIDYVPGSQSRYSGGGYSVLQLLLEDVTDRDFPDLMQELVLEPIDMESSLFYPGVPDSLKDLTAAGHDADGRIIEGRWESLIQMAAGGLLTTAGDLARFVVEVNRAWRGESEFLSGDLARETLSPQGQQWGLGFEVEGAGEDLRFVHTGAGDGFRALIVGLPELGAGAVILTNSDGGSELRYELLRSVGAHYGWPAFQSERRDTVRLPTERLRALSGRYEYSDGSVTEVTLEGGGLVARWGEMEPARLYPASDSLFFSLAGNEYVFRFGEDGDVRSVLWRGDFGAFEGSRVQ